MLTDPHRGSASPSVPELSAGVAVHGRAALADDALADDALADMVRGGLPFQSLHALDAMERVSLVKRGIPAQWLVVLADAMRISRQKLYSITGMARATADRKVRAKSLLSPGESERVLGLARLIGQAEQLVRESGTPEDFDAARWTAVWLDHPHPALGGMCPGTLMDTAEGRSVVSGLLGQIQSGAYA